MTQGPKNANFSENYTQHDKSLNYTYMSSFIKNFNFSKETSKAISSRSLIFLSTC